LSMENPIRIGSSAKITTENNTNNVIKNPFTNLLILLTSPFKMMETLLVKELTALIFPPIR